jgi:hypothetical protein
MMENYMQVLASLIALWIAVYIERTQYGDTGRKWIKIRFKRKDNG